MTSIPVDERVDVRVLVEWTDGGKVVLDPTEKPTFGPLPTAPGLYRFTFSGRPGQRRPRVYVGESENIRRRLAGNYRNPGKGQQTSLRINASLKEHLSAGGAVDLLIATAATAHIVLTGSAPTELALDLSLKAVRLLAENAALVTAQLVDEADIENLP